MGGRYKRKLKRKSAEEKERNIMITCRCKDIKGYEGLYLVTVNGEVISLHHINPKVLKPRLRGHGKGYMFVSLYKNGEVENLFVHRLVAQAFLENSEELPEINHKDRNSLNNCVDNLEWCTRQYNVDYSSSKRVAQFENGEKVAEYKSIAEAARQTGIRKSNIWCNLNGRTRTAGGYTWEYVN